MTKMHHECLKYPKTLKKWPKAPKRWQQPLNLLKWQKYHRNLKNKQNTLDFLDFASILVGFK